MEKEKKTTGFNNKVVSTTNVGDQAFNNSFATFIVSPHLFYQDVSME